ncbi:hypothetical protein PSAN_57060 [Pseudomonas antarctica]|uniref:Uncharacterized protein n=1 Tax=Pseudomonas antarctica TaxID=219572 RepID=A0ABQ6ZN37_9PSED|nr:hypothetical protein [Pseudomonas antarctica]KAF2405816.1 hypothetical protein PSAN_57060 [Pseudomonas antarctica]
MTTPTDPTDPSDPNYDISLNPPDFAFAASLEKLVGESATKALGVRATDPYADLFVETWKDRNIGDIIRLKIQDKDGKGDLLVASVTVSEIASRYRLMVPRKDLQDRVLVGQQEGLVTMYLELVRVGSKQISRSRSVTFLLKKSSPAGFDSRPDVEGHDGLRVVAEGLPQYSTVDSYVASKGMWVLLSKHANARANDLFTVFLAGVPTPYRLSAAEAAGPGPYRVFIPPSVFRDITQFGLLPLLYTVEDVAENPPAGNTTLSAPYYLNSDLDPSLFDPPYLLVNNVETTRLNLGTHGSLPFSVSVTPPRSIRLASPPNQIVVTLTFTKNEGTKKVTRLPSFAQTQARGEIIPVSSEVFNQPGFDFVHISYEMFSSTGALLGKSGSTSVSLEGVLVVTYPAPAFDGKLGPQTIVPQNYPNGATTTVGFPSMSTAHVIQLIWRYFDGTVAVIPAQTGNANGLVQFPISATIIAQSAGQPIKLSYLVTVGGTTVASEVQVLTVQAAPLLVLPQPLINRLDPGATLVLSSFNGDARASVVPWGGIQAGQVVWLTIINGARELKVLDGYLISEWEVTRGLMDKPVSRDWIKGLPNNTSVEVKFYVGQAGSTNIATATASPINILYRGYYASPTSYFKGAGGFNGCQFS